MKIIHSVMDSLLHDVRYRQANRQPRVHTSLAPLGLAPLIGLPYSRQDGRRE